MKDCPRAGFPLSPGDLLSRQLAALPARDVRSHENRRRCPPTKSALTKTGSTTSPQRPLSRKLAALPARDVRYHENWQHYPRIR